MALKLQAKWNKRKDAGTLLEIFEKPEQGGKSVLKQTSRRSKQPSVRIQAQRAAVHRWQEGLGKTPRTLMKPSCLNTADVGAEREFLLQNEMPPPIPPRRRLLHC